MPPQRFPPIAANLPSLWHGGDYNPDQWLDRTDIIDEDFRLFELAQINTVSLAIFAWSRLEPREGHYTFDWLDRLIDRCAERRIAVVLATPSGAKPNWMAARYPEIRRVTPDGRREPQQRRHNHCFTSPVYREKVVAINSRLAERYGRHPALALWHLSNEYGGECHCPLCKAAFRDWLRRRYGTLDQLNAAWWTAFWSHTFTDWEEVDAIDPTVCGMALDWRRFTSDQTVDFMRVESAPLKAAFPHVPVTTNLMGFYEGLDYWRLAQALDIVSWDNYPGYHDRPDNERLAAHVGFAHDLNRSLKNRPFLMMESSPSVSNWMPINRLFRPGVHRLKSLQAVAHGSDSVQYFQLRKGRGCSEQFHGAVIDHVGHERTRVFAEVAQVGEDLRRLAPVRGCATPAEVALVFDWEARWALRNAQGPSDLAKRYEEWTAAHHASFWRMGVNTDVLNGDGDPAPYRLLIAPSLYLLRAGFAARVEAFVQAGGVFVATWLTGIVDESTLSFLGGWPGPLRRVLGVWAEEIDYLYPDETNALVFSDANPLGLTGRHPARHVCDLIHAESAEEVATYADDFYAGRPALTVNRLGAGRAWYLAAWPEQDFLDALYRRLAADLNLRRALAADLPDGVTAQWRTDGERDFVFVSNFVREARIVDVGAPARDLLTDRTVAGPVTLPPRGLLVLERMPVRMQ